MAQAPVRTGKNGSVLAEAKQQFHDGGGNRRNFVGACAWPQNAKGRIARPCERRFARQSALARLETRIALADHENLAASADDFAVAVPLLGGLEGRKHFHGMPRGV
jgi:hypothetical protein